ncbi:MAG: protein-L-isoaspartate(D-aspartate) O-methyltransferase [Rubrivivax sp.]|nr:protein-L-isoaspartate(D-aspartate) O-methyltransferase [Rubrivivax sp.]
MSRRPARFPLPLDALRPGSSPVDPTPQRPGEVLRPQRPLAHAARESARSAAPSGLGLDSAAVRERMVARLRESGIGNERVLGAFLRVERHRFVDPALAIQAYEDTSLPIGLGQTISKPSVVARMLALAMAAPAAATRGNLGRVLEIGTGCGYQAALLACLSRHVVSIERLAGLHDKARSNLASLLGGPRLDGVADLRLMHADGRLGHVPQAPYDSIVAAAGGDAVPQAWLDQLALGGRLVAPVHDPGQGGQVLMVVDRHEHGLQHQRFEGVHFVPLKSGAH